MVYMTTGGCFQAEDGIQDLVRSRGLGDVYKRQLLHDVFGVFGSARHSERQSIQASAVPLDQHSEGVLIAFPGPYDCGRIIQLHLRDMTGKQGKQLVQVRQFLSSASS